MKYTSINFETKIEPVKKLNDSFTQVKIYAFGLGKNRNYSHVSKKNMERCKDSLSYAPVVGHIITKYDEDGNKVGSYMGGHDMYLDEDWNLKSATVPYGVVINDSFKYEKVKEYKDNKEREYLTCDAILWTGRYPELNETLYSEDVYFNESAELDVKEYRPLEEDSNYIDITDFEFSALCLLGKADENSTNGHTDESEHTEPCFIESKIIPQQFEQNEFIKIFSELKSELATCFDIENSGKEENQLENETIETVVNSAEEEVVETPEEVVEMAEEVVEEPAAEETEETVEEEPEDDSAEEAEESPEDTTPAEEEFDALEALRNEFEEYKNTHSHTNEEYDVLSQYKENIEKADAKAEKEKILNDEKYSVIAENDEYKKLFENIDNYSLADIEKEAKIILADFVVSTGEYSVKHNEVSNKKLGVKNKKAKGRYGNLFSK